MSHDWNESCASNHLTVVLERGKKLQSCAAVAISLLGLLFLTTWTAYADDSAAVAKQEIAHYFSDKTVETLEVEAEVVQCRVKPGRFADVVLVRKDFDKEGSTYHPRRWDLNVHLDGDSNPTRYSFTVWGFASAYALSTENISYLFIGEDSMARFNRSVELRTISDIARTSKFIFYKDSYGGGRVLNVTVTNPEQIKRCLLIEEFTTSKIDRFGFFWETYDYL